MLFNCFGNKLPTQVDKAIGREKLEFTEVFQQSIAGATAANNVIAQGAPVGNRLCANQESLDPRSKPGALPTQLDRHGIVGTEMI